MSAPYNWEPGDPRRPYPTDLQMRASLLQSLSTADSNAIHLTSQLAQALTPNQSGSYSWSGNQDLKPSLSGGSGGTGAASSTASGTAGRSPIYKGSKDQELDVEMMSSDSSSSTSSDSRD